MKTVNCRISHVFLPLTTREYIITAKVKNLYSTFLFSAFQAVSPSSCFSLPLCNTWSYGPLFLPPCLHIPSLSLKSVFLSLIFSLFSPASSLPSLLPPVHSRLGLSLVPFPQWTYKNSSRCSNISKAFPFFHLPQKAKFPIPFQLYILRITSHPLKSLRDFRKRLNLLWPCSYFWTWTGSSSPSLPTRLEKAKFYLPLPTILTASPPCSTSNLTHPIPVTHGMSKPTPWSEDDYQLP